ncbi:hypothetical protein Tco_0525074 [Tanacetum coccineum]
MESSNSNSKERELQVTQRLAKQRHSHCMTWFEQLETHLRDLYLNSSSHAIAAFKPAFHSFFGEEHHTFRLKMFHNLDQLRLQLERENLLEVNPRSCLEAPRTQRDLLETLDTLVAVIHRAVITYGRLQLQSQDVQINPVQAVDDRLSVSKSSGIEFENNNALSKLVNETQLQQHESLVTESTTLEANLSMDVNALDDGLAVTESNGTNSYKQDTSSSSGTYITHVVDADIRLVNDQVPPAEVYLTTQHNVLANELQHTDQSEPSYDTYLLEKVDSNTTPDATNMCHRGGEIDQDAEQDLVKNPLLNAEFLKTNDMVEKEVYNELSNRFLQLEKHCISLEISMQQKEESFQSNKPCKNQDAPEFCEFFKINDLKAQLQAKTTLICNLKNQIKSVKDASNEAKVKHDTDILETINIELESSVAKLLAENKKLNKENEHFKQTYKDLYASIKKIRIQTKDHNDSLIAQVNSKSVENADLKAQIQEKVFANVALKNELRKLKGNSVDTKFAKPSILGKPILQPPRNQSVVRQPNAFKSEQPNFSKLRFASQVDVNNILSKLVTPHYLPKVREYVLAKPHHLIAPGSSRNSQEEPYGSNDMTHNHYLEEARKKTQEKNRNSKPSVMPTTSLQNTTNGSKPNPRSNYQISRSLPVSRSSYGMSNGVSLVDHSSNSSSFSDSKHFVCSTCHKCVFNANHDNCITKFLKEVNSRTKVQSPKTRNNNKPVEPKNHTQKPGRQIAIGQRFSPKKSSAVHEKPNTPRSCLRWNPTGRIFKIASLRWIPTGKKFTDNTTKVDSKPPNGSNEDITNPYECDQTLNVSEVQASVLNVNKMASANNSLGPACQRKEKYFNPSPSVVQPVLVAAVQESIISIEPSSKETSSRIVILTNVHSVNQPQEHIEKWSKDHPLDKIIGDPSRPISIRLQLQTEALFCYYDALISSSNQKSYKDALTESCWIDAMKSSMKFHLADIFSKQLGQEKLEFLMKKVGMQSMSPETMKMLADKTEELWCYFRLQPALQNDESMSPKRRLFLTTGDSVLPGMDYFISVHPRSNVRFSALFLDTEEKSSFLTK